MEEDFKQLHSYIDNLDYKSAKSLLENMLNLSKDYHETTLDEFILNAFDDNHGLMKFILEARATEQFSDAIVEGLEILHVFVNIMCQKVMRYVPTIRQACLKVALSSLTSSKAKSRALDLLSLVIQKTDHFSNDEEIQKLYETLYNLFENSCCKKKCSVIALVIKALYMVIGKYYRKLQPVDMLCDTIITRLLEKCGSTSDISEIEYSFRFFDRILQINDGYENKNKIYRCVINRIKSDAFHKSSHTAALELLQHHTDLYIKEIHNDLKTIEKNCLKYLCLSGDIQKASYYTMNVIYEKLGDFIAMKNKTEICKEYLDKFFKEMNDPNKHGYELRLAILGYGYFAKCFKTHIPKQEITKSFLSVVLKIEKTYLIEFDSQSDNLNYLPDYVQTLSKIIEQLEDISPQEIATLRKIAILLIRLSPHLSSHHPSFITNPITITLNLIKKSKPNEFKVFMGKLIQEGIVYSCSHPIAYSLDNSGVVTYKNYLKLWVNLVEKNPEIYDELIKTLFVLISKLNLNVQKNEDLGNFSDPKVSLEAVKISDFNIFVNVVDLYVELLLESPKRGFQKSVKKYFDFMIGKSKKYPLISGFYKLIAVGLQIANSIDYFSNERLKRSGIKSYYELIENFVDSVLIRVEMYKDDLKLSCLRVILASPEIYVTKNLMRLTSAIISLFNSSKSNIPLVIQGVETLDKWITFFPQKQTEEFLNLIVPSLDTYLRSKTLSKSIDTSNFKQRKTKQALRQRHISKISEGDLLKLQKRILSFLGNVNPTVLRSLAENKTINETDQTKSDESLSLKIELISNEEINVYLEKFLPRVIDLALHCSERKLQITACETLQAIVTIFLGFSRINDSKNLDCQFKKAFKPLLILGSSPDTTVRQLIEPFVDQLIHWYSSPSQRNTAKLAILIESLLDGVTQRDDASLRDFSCNCIHELIKYSLKHSIGGSEDEFSNVKVIIWKIKQFCYHSDPTKRLAGALIFNSTYTLLREEKFVVDVYWLVLFQSLIYNLSQVEEDDQFDSLSYSIQSIDHVERVFREKVKVFSGKSKRRVIPNGFVDGTLESVANVTLNYRHAKNRLAKLRIYKFYYEILRFTKNKFGCLTFSPYTISNKIFEKSSAPNDVMNSLKKLMHILDTELSIYESESRSHYYEIDEKVLEGLEHYFEFVNSQSFEMDKNFDKTTFKNVKFTILKSSVQWFITASFYEEKNTNIQELTKKYGIKLLNDFLFCNINSVDILEETVLINLLEKIINNEFKTILINLTKEHILNNRLIEDDLQKGVSRTQKNIIKGLKILSKTTFIDQINFETYLKETLTNISLKLNPSFELSEESKKFCKNFLELYIEKGDLSLLLESVCDKTEIYDIETNENIHFGIYFYNLFKEDLLPIIATNFEEFLGRLPSRDNIYFFTDEIVRYVDFNRRKIATGKIFNVIIKNWKMYERYYVKDINMISEGLLLLESMIGTTYDNLIVTDEISRWILRCFDFENFNVLPERIYRQIEQLLSVLPIPLNSEHFDLFKEKLNFIKTNYFQEINSQIRDSAVIAINRAFQASIVAKSNELFIFSCEIFLTSKIRKEIDYKEYSKNFIIIIDKESRFDVLEKIFQMILLDFSVSSLEFIDLILSNLLRYSTYDEFELFYIKNIKNIIGLLNKPDDSETNIIAKAIGFILVKCLFARIDTKKFKEKSCEITKAIYDEKDIKKGTELVKNLFLISGDYLKQPIEKESPFRDILRICKCHSYNALISVTSNGIQADSQSFQFYNRLFNREVKGENVLWKNLIDLEKKYVFPVTFESLPKKTTQLVNIRTKNQTAFQPSYIESQTLYESTLSEDFRQYDFTKTILRSQEIDVSYIPNEDDVEMQVTVEADEINHHECMPYICGLIKEIHDDKIYGENVKNPKWIQFIDNDLKSVNTHRNVKLFLLKIIEKEQEIFKDFSDVLSPTIIDLILDETVGDNLNYFVIDLIIMLASWNSSNEISGDNGNISQLVLFLMKNTNRERSDIKKYHLNILKLVVESWKNQFEIPDDYILTELQKSTKSKKVEVIMNFCSIFMANDIKIWGNNLKKIASTLAECLNNSQQTRVPKICSETIGLCLRLAEKLDEKDFGIFKTKIIERVSTFDLGKYLCCLEGFIKSYPQICDGLLRNLINNFHKTPEGKRIGLMVFSERIEALQENADFSLLNFAELIEGNDQLKILGMEVIKKSVSKIPKPSFISLMEKLSKNSNNTNRICRMGMYEIFIEIRNKMNDRDILKYADDVLIQGLTDSDLEIQMKLIEFFDMKLPKNDINLKFLRILKDLYKPELEDNFLGYASKFLLKNFDLSKLLFDTPLQNINFSERIISDNWRNKHSSLVPLFASTYQSQDSLISSTLENPNQNVYLKATATAMEFEPTYVPESIAREKEETLRDVSFDDDEEFKVPFPVETKEKKMLKLRFRSDTTKTNREFALRGLSRKEKMEKEKVENEKRRQEMVVIYRRYRDGEIPDIEITVGDLITPLSHLIQHDSHLAEIFYTSFFHEILKKSEDKQDFLKELYEALMKIFKSSTIYNQYFISALLNTVIKLPRRKFSSSIIVKVASNSGLLSSGILVLEEYLIKEGFENDEKLAKLSPLSNPTLQTWVKLAEELQDYDTVKAIFLHKMDCKESVIKAISYEEKREWWEAEKLYLELLKTDNSLDRKDFYYESYFKCFAEMSKWEKMTEAIKTATGENVWEELWDEDFNQHKLLPWYISSEIKNSIEIPGTIMRFASLLNEAFADEKKSFHLKQYFSEEIGFLYLLSNNYDKSLFYMKNNMEKFLGDWQNTDSMLISLRVNKLTKIMNSVDIYNFINMINNFDEIEAHRFTKRWEKNLEDNYSSIVPLELRHTYRKKCLDILQEKITSKSGVWEEIKFQMDLDLLKTAVNLKNYYVAKKYLKTLHQNDSNFHYKLAYAKTCMLRISQHPKGSDNSFILFENAYKAIEPIVKNQQEVPLNFKLTATNTLHDILFSFTSEASIFKSQLLRLFPDLQNCDEVGLKKYAVEKLNRILDGCSKVSSLHFPFIASSYVKISQFYQSLGNSKDLIKSVLRAMYYGSSEARQLFPCLLDIEDVGIKHQDVFLEESKNLPEWLFIQWIPQLLSKLDTNCIFIIERIILKLAETYPQAVMYDYQFSKEKFNCSKHELNKPESRIYLDNLMLKLDKLLSNDYISDIISSLSNVANAKSIVFSYIINLQYACLLNDETSFKSTLEKLSSLCAKTDTDDSSSKIGPVYKKITELSKDTLELRKHIFDSRKLMEKLTQFRIKVRNSPESNSRSLRMELKLSYYSPYLENFMDNLCEDNIEFEIPGQYKANSKPLPQYHVKIAGFSPEVLVMKSLRKPIRIKIIGNDGKDHPFLVKVGEDLRQDQRIEQIFSLINDIFKSNPICCDRRLQISTYQVIPLTPNLGLIEWVENTIPLRQFLLDTNPKGLLKKFDLAMNRHCTRYAGKPQPIKSDYIKALTNHKPEIAATIYQELTNMVPSDILRKSIMSLSINSESFIAFRNTFITSYISTSMANWILGIGDRHLSNTLIDVQTARTIDIDFGHAFGSGVQIQPTPELVPFRLTPIIINLMEPLKEHGLIEQTMIHVMRTLRENRNSLISTIKVFINEPSMDWVQYKKLENQVMGYNWCGEEKIKHTEMKLKGVGSVDIMIEELRKRTSDKDCIEVLVDYVKGSSRCMRAGLQGELSVEDQVKVLLDHATDQNLLCRLYCGWEAWV